MTEEHRQKDRMEHPWRDALCRVRSRWRPRGTVALQVGTACQIAGAGKPVSVSLSESESRECETGYGHEKLGVYRAAIEYVGWAIDSAKP